ncbi:tRNA synthetases class II-domain-containing protein [Chaetomidium leptoderma]|uniref:tRNA synthetases class II-domain-containing protein n=1 Tax=Chaetomidium leptoderma TaxID=669021 RepID=A0AAN6VJ43_9PEZI|nr:tRNA synthetases class II-domain-containing protein [Chaetomidium leptoderma]
MVRPRVPLRRLCGLGQRELRCFGTYSRPQLVHARPLQSVSRLTHTATAQSRATKDGGFEQQKTVGQNLREEWARYNEFPRASGAEDFKEGQTVTVHGFLARKRVKHAKLVFADIQIDNGPAIQITSSFEELDGPGHAANQALRGVPLYSPVSVTGTVARLHSNTQPAETPPKADGVGRETHPPDGSSKPGSFPGQVFRIDLDLENIQPLNVFPKDIIVSKGVQFPPSARHLQIRFSDPLRTRLLVRPQIAFQLRKSLNDLAFTEVETPVLFKSTPEGAREFLVPTRRPGLAYALPQSPQQYKQMLMASGIRGYYQFARCFRDEDLRADRQPEFTQLDLEMSFATGKDVMQTVESIVSDLASSLNSDFSVVKKGEDVYLAPKKTLEATGQEDPTTHSRYMMPPFPRMSYEEAMTRFGIDKPDLRIPFELHRVDHVLPRSFISMITHLDNPVVETFRFRPSQVEEGGQLPTPGFIDELMKTLPPALARNPDGAPVALVVDSSKPLRGLSPLGFEGAGALESGEAGPNLSDLEDGDVLIFQARENKAFQGGSTAVGTLRTLLYQAAVANGLLPRDLSFQFLWVTNFPMFTPDNETDPGQGGQAGFSATHHPFTAPLTDEDVELLATDPLKARGDHYDLVVNGVELGGGSRRIHVAKMQEYVMREILKMTDAGVAQFSHLLEALRAGCPPHAGFALGFDRLVAVLTYTDSVRDVIAFPKSMKGEDLTVKSPGRITKEQLDTYHLAFPSKK